MHQFHDSTNSWSADSGGVIISNEPINENFCRIVISFEHFSSYGLVGVATDTSSSSSSQSSSSSGSSGGGATNSQGSPTSAEAIKKLEDTINDGANNLESQISSNTIEQENTLPNTNLPSWLKSVAQSWSAGESDEKSFSAVIQYLIDSEMISVKNINHDEPSNIPSWVKNTALWWSEDAITDLEFTSAISNLINRGILTS